MQVILTYTHRATKETVRFVTADNDGRTARRLMATVLRDYALANALPRTWFHRDEIQESHVELGHWAVYRQPIN